MALQRQSINASIVEGHYQQIRFKEVGCPRVTQFKDLGLLFYRSGGYHLC